ncbi:hypothetical protein Bbelb_052090 [Branchiostoma belcheri]|nr:hypothetical protein Bbelb_052090 [Branchiostoma belcheri]
METKDKGKLSPTSNYNGQRNNSTTGLRGQFCESSAKFCGTSPNLTQVLPQSPARRPAIFRRTYRGISQNGAQLHVTGSDRFFHPPNRSRLDRFFHQPALALGSAGRARQVSLQL